MEKWCIVKYTKCKQQSDACQEVMNPEFYDQWMAYWESPLNNVGERNAKNDNNKVHCGKVELDACQEVMDPEVHKW